MTWLVTIGLANASLAALLSVAALVCGRCLRRPALAHLLWIVVLLKLLAPPVFQVSLGDWFSRPTGWLGDAMAAVAESDASEAAAILPAPTASDSRAAFQPAPIVAPRKPAPISDFRPPNSGLRVPISDLGIWLRFAAIIWIVGSAAMLVWILRRVWNFRGFLKLSARPDAELQARVARLARRAGMRSAPKVVVVESVVSPMLWGLGCSRLGRGATLLFPGELARRLDGESCDALLLHELAHYARGDCWVRLLELVVQTLYWWHPLVWLARREIEAAEEECCDAWALAHQSAPRRLYAEALLATVDFLFEPPPAALPPAACGLGEARLLRRRLTQILCGEASLRPSRAWKALVLGGAAVALPLGPAFFDATANEAAARSSPSAVSPAQRAGVSVPIETGPASAAPLSLRERTGVRAPPETAHAIAAALVRSPSPSIPRAPSVLWATAAAPNGKYHLEARTGRKTTLIHPESGWRLDLSSHRIDCASFSPDSRLLATGHADSLVRLWDCETGGLLASFKGSSAAIASVAFAPDGFRVAAGADDGSLLVWDRATGDELARLPRQSAPVSCLRWSPPGDRLAVALGRWSGGESGSLVVWSLDERQPPEPQPLGESVGALEWLDDGETLLLAAWNGEARLWSVIASKSQGLFSIGKDAVSAANWSPDCPLVTPWQAEQLVRSGR